MKTYFLIGASLVFALISGVMVFSTPHQWGALPFFVASVAFFCWQLAKSPK